MHSFTVLALFIIIYIFIAIQRFPFIKIDRPAGVFTGVTLLILAGVITLDEGYKFVDLNVITFLMSMMIMISYLQISGFFGFAAHRVIKISKTPKTLLAGLIGSCAILSALFVNDTVCLLVTPIVLSSCRGLKIKALPYLIAVAVSSNVGSALTVTGNPQNMFIGINSDLKFLEFIGITFVPVIISLIFTYFVIAFVYRKYLISFGAAGELPDYEIDKPLMIKSLATLGFTIILFAAGISYPLAALIGASSIIVMGQIKPSLAMQKVDWHILLFFAGLFIVMGAFDKAGYTSKIMALAGGGLNVGSLWDISIFSSVIIMLSNMVSNLPAVILFMPMAGEKSGAALLALVSTFAGNLTLVGSVANLIVAEIAAGDGENIKFFEYMKTGFIITVFSCATAVLWIYLIF